MATMTVVKALTYNNRRMQPGEDFETKHDRDMKVLLATRKAVLKREPVAVPPPPPAVAAKIEAATKEPEPDAELVAAREEYKRIVGRAAYHGWDVDTINERIASHSEPS